MKIVIAPDSFKGSLTAKEVGWAIHDGFRKVLQADTDEIVVVPMADGGEGTLQCLIEATNGKIVNAKVKNPIGDEIDAYLGVLGDQKTCIIETAVAMGLYLISEEERNPMATTTYGVGELIRSGLDLGCRRFILALGGSATNDGGAGMLQALGVQLLDEAGQALGFGGGELGKLHRIEIAEMDNRIQECEFIIACDVNNPFIGSDGASHIFGPQKGASPQMAAELDRNLRRFADVIQETLGIAIHNVPGTGAAGGLAGGILAFLNGKLNSGIQIVIESTGLENEIRDADLVITGEGQVDFQTAHGKTAWGVAQLAKAYDVPTIVIAGSIGRGIDMLFAEGIDAVFSIVNKPMTLQDAMERAEELLTATAEQIARLWVARKQHGNVPTS